MIDLKGLSTLLFGGVVDRYSASFTLVKRNLPKADIRMPFRTYMSLVFFTTLIAYVSSLIALLIVLQMLESLQMMEISFMLKVSYITFVPVLIAVASFAVLSFYPIQKSISRKKSIESNLPFVLTHMGAVAESGVPPTVIFRLISEFEEYGEIAKEMKKIVRNMETFGIDPLTAVKEVAERTPSDAFKQTLLGFITTTESGGDVKMYLKSAGQQALFEWRLRRERFLQQLSAYAEFYTGLLIAAPLFIIALFAVMNMIQPNIAGYNILDLTKLSIYLLVPALNTGFLLLLRGVEVEM